MENYKRYELEWSVPDLKIWVVDGKIVRETFEMDYTTGGHDKVYDYFIPANEIWIDSSNSPDELPFVVLHEVYERWLMCNGLDYDTAHGFANKFEKLLRDKGDICLTSQIIKTFIDKNIEVNQATPQMCVEVTIL